jgi:excisionase family DNA binding protein
MYVLRNTLTFNVLRFHACPAHAGTEIAMLALLDQTEPFAANETEAVIARAAAQQLKALAEARQDVTIVVQSGTQPKVLVPLPARAVELIFRILQSMGDRVPVSVIPHEAELTTQQAADYLNVSRPYLIKLLDAGEMEHRVVGRHRRVRFGVLLEYQKQSMRDRQAAIDEMAAEARELGLD